MYKRVLLSSFLIGASFVMVTQFQNCAKGNFESASLSLKGMEDVGVFGSTEHWNTDFHQKPQSNFAPPMMDRQMVSSVLENAFGPSWKIETSNIENLGAAFGKGCSLYEEYLTQVNGRNILGQDSETCRPSSTNFQVGLNSFATAERSSYLMAACSELSQNNTTLTHFTSQLGSSQEQENFSDEALSKAYRLFFVGKPQPSITILDSLRFIAMDQSDPKNAWAAISFTLCSSGQWQVL